MISRAQRLAITGLLAAQSLVLQAVTLPSPALPDVVSPLPLQASNLSRNLSIYTRSQLLSACHAICFALRFAFAKPPHEGNAHPSQVRDPRKALALFHLRLIVS